MAANLHHSTAHFFHGDLVPSLIIALPAPLNFQLVCSCVTFFRGPEQQYSPHGSIDRSCEQFVEYPPISITQVSPFVPECLLDMVGRHIMWLLVLVYMKGFVHEKIHVKLFEIDDLN